MHIKFLRHGQGSVRRAVDYLLGGRDHKGEVRPGVRILAGDAGLTALHGDSITRQWRYSSAVLAWHPQDEPEEAQVQGVLDDFAELAGAELADPVSGLTWLAVEHRTRESVHVHVLVVREDAATGRAFNPAPPPTRRDFDHVRDAWNAACGWADPGDPARARPVPGPRPGRNDERERIGGALLERAVAGQFPDRDALLAAVGAYGEVTRAGRDYVSVRPAGAAKAIRLKGGLFAADAPSAWAVEHRPQPVRPGPDPERAAAARVRLDAAIARRKPRHNHEDEEATTHGRERHTGPDLRVERGAAVPGSTAGRAGALDGRAGGPDLGAGGGTGPGGDRVGGVLAVEDAAVAAVGDVIDAVGEASGVADAAAGRIGEGRRRLAAAVDLAHRTLESLVEWWHRMTRPTTPAHLQPNWLSRDPLVDDDYWRRGDSDHGPDFGAGRGR